VEGKNIYVLAYKGPACDWFPTFYDSNAKQVPEQRSYDEFIKESTFVKNIWICNYDNE